METFSSMSMNNKYEIGMFIHGFMFIYSRDVENEIFFTLLFFFLFFQFKHLLEMIIVNEHENTYKQ